MNELTEFCKRVCAIHENPEEFWYLRLRSGKARKTAEVIASGIECTGVQSFVMERILEERIRSAGAEDPVWVEAIQRGTSQIRDTIKIFPDEDVETEPAAFGLTDVLGAMTDTVLKMAMRAEERADRASQNNMETQAAFLRTFQEWALTKAQLETTQETDYSQALSMLAGLAPAIVQKLSGDNQIAPTSADEHADALVGAIRNLAHDHPEVITPQRLAQLAPILGMGSP